MNFQITPFAIASLFLFIPCLFLAITLRRTSTSKIAKIYSYELLVISLWGVCAFIIGSIQNKAMAMFFWKIGYAAVIFIPVLFMHTTYLLTNRKMDLLLLLVYAQATYFGILSIKGEMFASVGLIFNSFYYFIGTKYYKYSFILWILTVLILHYFLIKYLFLNKSSQKDKNDKRLLILLLAALPLGFCGGILNFLPGFAINIYPAGNFFVAFYVILLSYYIFRHQLMGVQIIFKKGLVYSTTLTLISTIYLLSIIFIDKYFQKTFGYESVATNLIVILIFCIIFIPLRYQAQKIIDRLFFKGSRDDLITENERLRREIIQSEKLKTMSTLSSGIAHEIKNPLTSIKTFADHLPNRMDDKEFLLKFSRIVGHEVNRINDLVHQLMDYAKPDPLERKKTDIHKLINNLLDVLSNQFLQKKIHIQKNFIRGNPVYLYIDERQIHQAFMNIMLNAIEHMDNEGVLTIQTFLEDSFFVIQISDTGRGINPKDIKHIFDPFFTQTDHGTGLGLSITQSIIKQHNGKILVESKLGQGTTFSIHLPLSD